MIESLAAVIALALAVFFVVLVATALISLVRLAVAIVLLPFRIAGWLIGGVCTLALAAVAVAALAPLLVLLALVVLPVVVVGGLLALVIRLAA